MQHYQAAGFSEEVSRLATAPMITRRSSTNRMYDDRWLPFSHYATGQGIDLRSPNAAPQVATFLYTLFDAHSLSLKRSRLQNLLSLSPLPHGKAAAVQGRTVSGMIASMELHA